MDCLHQLGPQEHEGEEQERDPEGGVQQQLPQQQEEEMQQPPQQQLQQQQLPGTDGGGIEGYDEVLLDLIKVRLGPQVRNVVTTGSNQPPSSMALEE